MMFNQTDLGLTELTLQQTAATQMAEKLIKDIIASEPIRIFEQYLLIFLAAPISVRPSNFSKNKTNSRRCFKTKVNNKDTGSLENQ